MALYEQRPVSVWVLILVILAGGWVGGAGLILIFDQIFVPSASAQRSDASIEILRRMKEIEEQQKRFLDQIKSQSSDSTSIAKLQEQYVSLSERMNWVLKGLGLAFVGGVGWAFKQIRMASAATNEVRQLLANLHGGGSLGIEPHGHSGTDAS